jgi:hypothetical protein
VELSQLAWEKGFDAVVVSGTIPSRPTEYPLMVSLPGTTGRLFKNPMDIQYTSDTYEGQMSYRHNE